jgi:hypothetical protein
MKLLKHYALKFIILKPWNFKYAGIPMNRQASFIYQTNIFLFRAQIEEIVSLLERWYNLYIYINSKEASGNDNFILIIVINYN